MSDPIPESIAGADLSESIRVLTAARETGVYFVNTQTRWILVSGADAERHLQAMVTQDLSDFASGERRLAALADDRGHYLADFWIFRNGSGWYLDIAAGLAQQIAERLELFAVNADVKLVVSGAEQVLFHLEGPGNLAVFLEPLGIDSTSTAMMTGSASWDGGELEFLCRSLHGERGWTFAVPASHRQSFESMVHQFAEREGWKSATPEVQELLRIESGRAVGGRDLNTDYLLQEAGFNAAVSLDKGCYPGQEILQRIARQGNLKRELCTIQFTSRDGVGIHPGQAIMRTGTELGRITSYALDPRDNGGLGLAWLDSGNLQYDEPAEIEIADRGRVMKIMKRPLYKNGIGILPEVR